VGIGASAGKPRCRQTTPWRLAKRQLVALAASWRFQFVFDERQRRRWVLCTTDDVIVADSASSFARRQQAEKAAAESLATPPALT